jgi:dihydrolipoamide dehydrogenase
VEVVSLAERFDVVIIGGGPGGYGAALYGASAGLRIAVIEKNKVGGTCLHVGCIPAKELLETASVYRHVAGAKEFGIAASQPTIDFGVTQARKQKVVDRLFKGLQGTLKSREVTIYDGHGRLHADRRVTVSGAADSSGAAADSAELTGDAVILAPGSVPRTIPGFDIEGTLVMTSDEVLDIEEIPASVAVIGGGAVGCEFASLFADLGSQVTILEALPKLLPGCDNDVTSAVNRAFKKRGIDVRTKVEVKGHTPNDKGGTTVELGDGSLEVDKVIVSVGRRPNTQDMGLEGTAVRLDDGGFLQVDPQCRTGEPRVWAIGDAIATPALAHVGFSEGIGAIKEILDEPVVPVDYGSVPWCIYCHPEVAFAGHSEQSAKDAGFEVVTSTHRYGANGRAMILGETDGLVKVIAEKGDDDTAGRILGVHMVGPWVTEQLGQGYLAVNWEATAADVAHFIQPHPTLSELFGESALSLTGRSLNA